MNKEWLTHVILYHRKKNVQGNAMMSYIHDLGIYRELEWLLPQILIDWKDGVFLY